MTEAFAIAEFAALPDVVLAKEKERQANTLARSTHIKGLPSREYSEDEREALPGTRLDKMLPVTEFLEDVFGMQLCADGLGMTFPSSSGGWKDNTRHVHLHLDDEDGIQRATAYGEFTAASLGVDVGEGSHSTFSFLISAFCDGDARLAARIAKHFADNENVNELVELLQLRPNVDELRAALPIRSVPDENQVSIISEDGSGALSGQIIDPAAGHKGTLLDGLQPGKSVSVKMGATLPGDSVQVGGRTTGYYVTKTAKNEEGEIEKFEVAISEYVAFRSKVTERMQVGINGETIAKGEPEYSVTIVTDKGVVKEKDKFTAADSTDIKKVLERMNVGVGLPLATEDRMRLNNMLMTLGWGDTQKETQEFTSTGWVREPSGKHVLVLPAGSMTADGITDEYSVGAPANSEDSAMKPAQRATGFDYIAEGEELRKAAACVKAFIGMTPRAPGAAYAGLGGMSASILPLSRKTTVFLTSTTGTGKSLWLAELQAFMSGASVTGTDFSMSFQNSSKAGVAVVAGWANCTPMFADDFRLDGDPDEDKAMRKAASLLIQLAYGSDRDTKGTQGGGIRGGTDISTLAFISGEGAPPSGPAIINRFVSLDIKAGDIIVEPIGSSPVDAFRSDYAESGLARAFFSGYARWIARQLDMFGSVAKFRADNDRLKKDWARERGSSRASENAATLAVGWLRMHQWAAEEGITDLLPAMEDISQELEGLINTNLTASSEANYGTRIVNDIADILSGGKGYFLSSEGNMPSNQHLYGWEKDRDPHTFTYRNRALLGFLSEDRKHVLIVPDGMKLVKERLKLDMGPQQVAMALQNVLTPGTKPNAEAPTWFRLAPRKRGYVFPAELFGLPTPDAAPVLTEGPRDDDF